MANPLDITNPTPKDPTVTSVADTTTESELVASNDLRSEVEITNTSSADLYILKGTGTPSSTNLTAVVPQDSHYSTDFSGAIQGIWATNPNDGSALITETE